jgi:hypothetical protein
MSKVLKIVLGGLLVAQTVAAQPGAGQPARPADAPAPPVDVSVPQRSNLSPQEMVTRAREYRTRANEVIAKINAWVEEAKKAKDIIRLNCLLDKLVQAKANLNIADRTIINLEEGIRRGDEGASFHEFTRLTIINQQVQVLEGEAQQCVGEDLTFIGATQVDVKVDPGVRTDDPTNPGIPTGPVDRPPVEPAPVGTQI